MVGLIGHQWGRWLGVIVAFVAAACAAPPERLEAPTRTRPIADPETDGSAALRRDAPAVTGGTLLLASDGTLIASDAARDRLYVVEGLGTDRERAQELRLQPHDEPGRAVEDALGRVHIALRGGGALLTLDPDHREVLFRRPVCPAPRGVAWDADAEAILVACAGGELVTLAPSDGGELDRRFVDTDLRDVIVTDDARYVTRFRSAEVLTLDPSGAIVARRAPVSVTHRDARGEWATSAPNVAWRTVGTPAGDLLMLHQRSFSSPLEPGFSSRVQYYGSAIPGCTTAVVYSSVTLFPADGADPSPGPVLDRVALAVDVTLSPDGSAFALTSSASRNDGRTVSYPLAAAEASHPIECLEDESSELRLPGGVGVVYTTGSQLAIQRREPAGLIQVDLDDYEPLSRHEVELAPDSSVDSEGHRLFHRVGTSNLACASCHPEGGEDGHTWDFENAPPRRTQTLRGGVMGTAPFHWDGEHASLDSLMSVTFTQRMRGPELDAGEVAALGNWLDTLPAIPAPSTDPALVEYGSDVFEMAGCASCHSGELGTNNESVTLTPDGEALQVPLLRGVAHRSPWLNDGCATSLEQTIDGSCAPGHGSVVPLDDEERAALIEYLRSR